LLIGFSIRFEFFESVLQKFVAPFELEELLHVACRLSYLLFHDGDFLFASLKLCIFQTKFASVRFDALLNVGHKLVHFDEFVEFIPSSLHVSGVFAEVEF
jgi:hypothetical protein